MLAVSGIAHRAVSSLQELIVMDEKSVQLWLF